jgi:hypothetical protein
MTSDPGGQGRVLGVWGTRAYGWSGEERPRAAGFALDVSGRQRVLGFAGGPSAPGGPGTLRYRRVPRAQGRTRLVVAVVAILGGRRAGQPHARG